MSACDCLYNHDITICIEKKTENVPKNTEKKKKNTEAHKKNKKITSVKKTKDSTLTGEKNNANEGEKNATEEEKKCEKTMHLDNIKCMYFNADMLRKKLPELEIRSQNYDLIIVTEALPKHSKYDVQQCELQLPGFNRIDNFLSRVCKRGITIYARPTLKMDLEDEYNCDSFVESILIRIQVGLSKFIHILTVYRSPNSCAENNTELISMIHRLSCTPKIESLVIVGDFNLGGIDWDTLQSKSQFENRFIDCVLSNYLYQICTEPTRYRQGQTPSILDLILVKDAELIKEVVCCAPLGKSDHVVLDYVINVQSDLRLTKPITYRLGLGNYDQIRGSLGIVDWRGGLSHIGVTEMFGFISSHIVALSKEHIPVSDPFREQKPIWSSNEVVTKVKNKRSCFHKQLFVPSLANIDKYDNAKRISHLSVNKAKIDFEKKIADEVKTHPKSFWRYVNSKLKVNHSIPDLVVGQVTYSSPTEKAECLNNYFASVFNRDPPPSYQTFPRTPPTDSVSFTSVDISRDIIRNKLLTIKTDKSAGPDEILPRVLYECREELVEPLYALFCESLKQGVIPNQWKEAIVVPIFKKGSKKNPGNYRPISLTSVVCKILESIIRDQLLDYLIINNHISPKQFGFLPGKSCQLQLLSAVSGWIEQLDSKNNLTILYTDFCKAFDSVSHRKLVNKLHHVGIVGGPLHWISDFLDSRTQRVRLDGCLSHSEKVVSGVPQGSVLGPILFLVFINDITLCPQFGRLLLYADDAKISWVTNSTEQRKNCQDDINNLVKWSEENSLSFNSNKCKILHLGTPGDSADDNHNHIYTMGGGSHPVDISTVLEEKDLGVTMDGSLCFRSHIGNCVRKANSMLGIIKRTFSSMGPDIFVGLYKSLVRPHVEYSSPVWSPATVEEIRLIEGVQRRGTAQIKSLEGKTYEQRLRKLGLPSLEYRRLRADLIQVYRIFQGIDKLDITDIFVLDTNDRTRHHPRKIFKGRWNYVLKRNSFQYRVISLWNILHHDTVMAHSLNDFKSKLNLELKDHKIKFCPSFM